MRRLGPLAAAAMLAAASPAIAQGGAVVFQVDHVRDEAGHVRIDLCTEATFLHGDCPYSGAAPAVKGVTTVRIENIPPGVYAAQVYHDRNDNHAVDRSKPFGIPVEGVGFSNNAPIGLHGPKWANAAFTHAEVDQELAVRLHRYQSP